MLQSSNRNGHCQDQAHDQYRGDSTKTSQASTRSITAEVSRMLCLLRTRVWYMGSLSRTPNQVTAGMGSPATICVSAIQSSRKFLTRLSCVQSLEKFTDVPNARGGQSLCHNEMGKRTRRIINSARNVVKLSVPRGFGSGFVAGHANGNIGNRVILALVSLLLFPITPAWCQTKQYATYYTEASCKREGTSGVWTASGARYEETALTCALPSHAFGGWYEVCHEGKCVKVKHNDFGPSKKCQKRGVIIDLSPRAFSELAPLKKGKILVTVERISS